MSELSPILQVLLQPRSSEIAPILPVSLATSSQEPDDHNVAQSLNTAFLILLAGEQHPEYGEANTQLATLTTSSQWGTWAKFYLDAAQRITAELAQHCQQAPALKSALQQVEAVLTEKTVEPGAIAESTWAVLFPEGTGILDHQKARINQLRAQRTVTIDQLNPTPIAQPSQEILFTSNVLLTTPLDSADLSTFDADFITQLTDTAKDPQLYWYDHPIPIGVTAENNEILYGLKHLNAAVETEQQRHPKAIDTLNCVLSVSVTHKQLQTLGKQYLKQELKAYEPLNNLNIFAFTEADTDALLQQVLLPIVEHGGLSGEVSALQSVFGVDGRYGRHYSFLKAIAALWHVLVDPAIKATFKIDLDQVFPQTELIEQTGKSAFEHLQTPLWGAVGKDSNGQPIELGMIAGALVNQKDIHNGIFTPDVTFPDGTLNPDEYCFFSRLPQALSTEAEMMTRYQEGTPFDGQTACLQRIHVTGGTNGILVDSLRRFQPFTPSFIARAEDQAYLLSTFGELGGDNNLGYAHASGLIMRHDKEGFAQEAIAKAKVGKQIGDYLRILMFSAYADALPLPIQDIKAITAPFTGCFISQIPTTVALLRFSLKVATLFHKGQSETAMDFMRTGIPQLQDGLTFTEDHEGQPSDLQQTYQQERQGWQLFYECLSGVEKALAAGEDWALAVKTAAKTIVSNCRVN